MLQENMLYFSNFCSLHNKIQILTYDIYNFLESHDNTYASAYGDYISVNLETKIGNKILVKIVCTKNLLLKI